MKTLYYESVMEELTKKSNKFLSRIKSFARDLRKLDTWTEYGDWRDSRTKAFDNIKDCDLIISFIDDLKTISNQIIRTVREMELEDGDNKHN